MIHKVELIRSSIMPLLDFLEKRNILYEDFHERKFYHSELYPITIFFFFEGNCWFTTSAIKGATGKVDPNILPENIKKKFDRYRHTFTTLEL